MDANIGVWRNTNNTISVLAKNSLVFQIWDLRGVILIPETAPEQLKKILSFALSPGHSGILPLSRGRYSGGRDRPVLKSPEPAAPARQTYFFTIDAFFMLSSFGNSFMNSFVLVYICELSIVVSS